jgi:halimadienyl-diphosphate synthase
VSVLRRYPGSIVAGMAIDDVRREATALLLELADDPYGDVSASVYETGRLVSLCPWLAGHAARVEFLCEQQSEDGTWGRPDGYGLVPTLSATEALLTTLRRAPGDWVADPARVALAAGRGLRALSRWLRPPAAVVVPDTIAVEVLVPALVAQLNAHLDAGFGTWPDGDRLAVPAGMAAGAPAALLARLGAGDAAPAPVPQTWWASLEALGPDMVGAPGVLPEGGAVGCSAAATAAWLGGDRGASGPSVAYLDRLQARLGGPVPGVAPITYFERAWVLSSLAGAGVGGDDVAPHVLDSLDNALGPAGAPAAEGLPPDADDSAGVLTALARHGRARSPDCLFGYRTKGYFACFPGERTPSVSTNAHVLDAIGTGDVADQVAAWLLDQQRPDGSWYDKWHASAYYATHCCVAALADRDDERTVRAVEAAVDWVLATRLDDGSWGRWGGTVEETAYAVQILACASPVAGLGNAVAAGCAYLRATPVTAEHPALWHAKDLYAPLRVVRAARLAALAVGDGYRPSTGSSASSTRRRGRRVAPARTATCGGPTRLGR